MAAGHDAQIPQESIVPISQIFRTIFPDSSVDCLKELITHFIADEVIDITVQEMKRNCGQQPENKKERNMIDIITITIKGVFDIRFQNTWL